MTLSVINYIPDQYLCEFIETRGIDEAGRRQVIISPQW